MGKRRLDAEASGALADLQWVQAGAALLVNEWAATSSKIGGVAAALAESAEARPSGIDGTGLFATRDMEMGTLVTLYRPDLTVDEAGTGLTIDGEDASYFQSPLGQRPLSQAHFVFPPGLKTSAAPNGCPRFWVGANPLKADVPGWLGHRVNDGAACASDDDIERYLLQSGEKRNAVLVPLCVPLMGVVLSRDVTKGDEILATYGHDAWLGEDLEPSHPAPVAELLRKNAAEYAGLTLIASQNYGRELLALANFVRTGDTDASPPDDAPKRRPGAKSKGFGS